MHFYVGKTVILILAEEDKPLCMKMLEENLSKHMNFEQQIKELLEMLLNSAWYVTIFVLTTDICTTLCMIIFEETGSRCQLLWHDEENADTSVWGKGVYSVGHMKNLLLLHQASYA